MKTKSLLSRSGAAVSSSCSAAGQNAHTTPQLRVEQQEETFPSSSTVNIMGITVVTDIMMKTAQLYTKSYNQQNQT